MTGQERLAAQRAQSPKHWRGRSTVLAGDGRRPVGVRLLALLLLLLATSALYGGALLIVDPSGGLLGMPVSLLAGSPFRNYLLPGVVLFGLLGVAPLAVIAGLWFRPRWAHLPRWGVHGAWLATVGVGAALIVWILVQMTILRFFLQPILLSLGVAIVGVSLLPPVRRHYAQRSLDSRRPVAR